jgi:hypothetical protein
VGKEGYGEGRWSQKEVGKGVREAKLHRKALDSIYDFVTKELQRE